MPATGKTLLFDGVMRRSETVADVSRIDILYQIVHSLGYNHSDLVEWRIPEGTIDVEILPRGLTVATGLLVRVNRKPEETHLKMKFRIDNVADPVYQVQDFLVWTGTSITKLYVTNDSGGTVDAIIHFFG